MTTLVVELVEGLIQSFLNVNPLPGTRYAAFLSKPVFRKQAVVTQSRYSKVRERAFTAPLFVNLIGFISVKTTARSSYRSTSRPPGSTGATMRVIDVFLHSEKYSPGVDFRRK
jgi:hypothetical protein